MNGMIVLGTVLAMLGTGLLSGFVFAFSNVVMPSLARQDPATAIRTMQTINVVVGNGLFSALLAGTTLLAIALGGVAITDLGATGAPLLLAGSLAYLALGLGITVTVNVPMNRQLARVDPIGQQGPEDWRRFVRRWVFWNHARTMGSTLACLAFGLALARL